MKISLSTEEEGISSKRLLALLAGGSAPFVELYLMFQPVKSFSQQSQIAFYIGMGCAFFAIGITFQRAKLADAPFVVDFFATTLVLIADALIIAPIQPSMAVSCISMFLGGIGLAWMFLRWFSIACLHSYRAAGSIVLLSYALAALIRLAFLIVPSSLSYTTIVFLIAYQVISLLIVKTEKQKCEKTKIYNNEIRVSEFPLKGYAPYLAELAFCALVLGLFWAYSSESQRMSDALIINHILRFLLPIVIFFWFNRDDEPPYMMNLLRLLLLIGILALLAASLLGGSELSATISIAMLSFARIIVVIVAYLVSLKAVFENKAHPFIALGYIRAILETGLAIGIIVSWFIDISSLAQPSMSNILFFIAGVVFVFSFNRLVIVTGQISSIKTAAASEAAHENDLHEIYQTISQEYGLTDRELEIMEYICAGFSKGYISTKLYLSENTVRWHSKKLYEKLGVHSKQELLDLVLEKKAK